MKAVAMNGTGGRDVLEYAEWPDPVAGPGQAVVRISFAGGNFMDMGVRQGMPWTEPPIYPLVLGVEGAGRVEGVGEGVEDAAVMMQGLTASHFATDFHPVRRGDIAFVHAAAGGVGMLLTQLVKMRGG